VIKDTHEKFRAKHANYVEGMIGLDDREMGSVDQTDGKVFMCQELRCEGQKAHCHRKRPYMIWQGERA
jgi:hypothetical protein